jgi:hypothetical protein
MTLAVMVVCFSYWKIFRSTHELSKKNRQMAEQNRTLPSAATGNDSPMVRPSVPQDSNTPPALQQQQQQQGGGGGSSPPAVHLTTSPSPVYGPMNSFPPNPSPSPLGATSPIPGSGPGVYLLPPPHGNDSRNGGRDSPVSGARNQRAGSIVDNNSGGSGDESAPIVLPTRSFSRAAVSPGNANNGSGRALRANLPNSVGGHINNNPLSSRAMTPSHAAATSGQGMHDPYAPALRVAKRSIMYVYFTYSQRRKF